MFEFFLGIYAFTAGVFVFGSIMFWAAFLLLTGLIFWFDDRESPIWATLTVLATVYIFDASGLINITGPVMFLVSLVIYIGLGIVYSVVKWYFHLSNKKDQFLELKATFVAKHNARFTQQAEDEAQSLRSDSSRPRRVIDRGMGESLIADELMPTDVDAKLHMSDEMKKVFRSYLARAGYFRRQQAIEDEEIIPSALNNKLKIMGWATYWPWSGAWTLINEPVRRAIKMIWKRLSSTYQLMANKAFAGVDTDY